MAENNEHANNNNNDGDNIEEIFSAWENAIMVYDRTTRPILRRLRAALATADDEQLESLMDACGKLKHIPSLLIILLQAELLELGEEMLLRNLDKLDNDLIQIDESDNSMDAADSGVEEDAAEGPIIEEIDG